jgi:catechol-2,3-dioxygenase
MKIKELEIFSNNLEDTSAFYKDVLGLSLVNRDERSLIFKSGSTLLKFVESDVDKAMYHFAFNIPCNKIEEAVEFMSSRADLLNLQNDSVIADFTSWNAKAIYFYDNNRNIVELIARQDLNNASDKPFSGESILCISEIGISASYPVQLAKNIHDQLGVPYFEKSPGGDEFVAMGDDEGLFIIVKTGRHWYPTDVPARKLHTRIKAVSGSEEFELTF